MAFNEDEQQTTGNDELSQLNTELSAQSTVEDETVQPTAGEHAPVLAAENTTQTVKKVNFLKRDLGLSSLTGGLSYSLVVLLYIGANLLTLLIVRLAHINTDNDVFTYLAMLIAPLAICVAAAIILNVRKVRFKEICPVKTKSKYYLLAVLLTIGCLGIGTIASGIFLTVLEFFGYTPTESPMPDFSGIKIIPAIISVAVVPALFEELMFRGVILHSAEKSMGGVRAILVTGFCFSLMHGSPQQTVHQFLLGCGIAFLTLRSGSILPGMFAHFLNNLIALMISLVSDSILTANQTVLGIGTMIFLQIASAAFIGALVWLIFDKKNVLSKCQKGGVKVFFISATLGIVIMSVMWLLDLFAIL